eukprot:gene16104-22246_t
MARAKVLDVYKQLLKTVNTTFSGDTRAIRQGSAEIRKHFEASKDLNDPNQVAQKIADAVEAREFIRDSVVQAKKTSTGSYAVSPEEADRLQAAAPNLCQDKRK